MKEEEPELFELKHRDRAKLETLHLSLIDVPDAKSFDLGELAALGDSIRRVGLLNKPTVIKDGKRYTVVVGRRRIAAMQMLTSLDPKNPERDEAAAVVECFVRDHRTTSDTDIAKLILTENARRSANVLAELEAINALLKHDKMTIGGVAKSVGQPTSWVYKRIALNQLLPKFLQEMRRGRLKFETARAIAKLSREQQTRVWERFAEKRRDDKDAVISGKDVSDTLARSTAALPQELFKPLPPTEGAPGGAAEFSLMVDDWVQALKKERSATVQAVVEKMKEAAVKFAGKALDAVAPRVGATEEA